MQIQVISLYNDQLQESEGVEPELHATIEKFRDEELEHKALAIEEGGVSGDCGLFSSRGGGKSDNPIGNLVVQRDLVLFLNE